MGARGLRHSFKLLWGGWAPIIRIL